MDDKPNLVPLFLGLLLLAALVGAVSRFGELERFLALTRNVEPSWLLSCILLQSGTYLCEALAWRLALRAFGRDLSLPALIPLSIAKLFSDQAMPSSGISGNAFFVAALRRRGIAPEQAMSCMLIDLAAYFSSYASMTLASLAVLAWHHVLSRWLFVLTAIFVALQMSVPLALWHVARHGRLPGQALLLRSARTQKWMRALRQHAAALPRRALLFVQLTGLHAAILLLDAGTLWMLLLGIGQDVHITMVFSSFVTASMVMSLSPIPMGLGTFEATCVAMLHSTGIGLEAALTATILLRGVTAWLPMVPGMFLVRRAMHGKRRKAV